MLFYLRIMSFFVKKMSKLLHFKKSSIFAVWSACQGEMDRGVHGIAVCNHRVDGRAFDFSYQSWLRLF